MLASGPTSATIVVGSPAAGDDGTAPARTEPSQANGAIRSHFRRSKAGALLSAERSASESPQGLSTCRVCNALGCRGASTPCIPAPFAHPRHAFAQQHVRGMFHARRRQGQPCMHKADRGKQQMAKINPADQAIIFDKYTNQGIPVKDLAKTYRCTTANIYHVINKIRKESGLASSPAS